MKTKLKTKLKKCILYAIWGDTIAFINGFYKYKSEIFSKSFDYSHINITGWTYSINIIFLWYCFVIFHWQKKCYKKKYIYYNKYYSYLTHNLIFVEKSVINSESYDNKTISKYKYSDYFFKHKLVKNFVNKKKIINI